MSRPTAVSGARRRPAGRPPQRSSRRWQAPLGSPARRLTIGLVGCALIASALGVRAVQLQAFDPGSNAVYAQNETLRTTAIPATRGAITDRNGELLVSSEPAVHIVADPTIVASNGLDPAEMGLRSRLKASAGPGLIAGILYNRLGGNFEEYYNILRRSTGDEGQPLRYAVVSRNVRDYKNVLVTQDLSNLGYVGIDEEQAPVRHYPQGTLAANLLGFMVYDQALDEAKQYPWSGGGGLELALNTNLAGVDGREVYEATSYGRIPTGSTVLEAPQNGVSYELTIDAGLQYQVEQRLQQAVAEHKASSGVAIVMNVKNGELLALANYPTFDPNDLGAAKAENLSNQALTEVYEPGSVEKVLTMAALLDSGLVTPQTRVLIPSYIMSGGRTLNDDSPHGTLSFTATGVLAHSSNIGTALLTRQIDKGQLSDYLTSFGLGQATGLAW
ncbi:MAG: penicillin-binding protein 2, partial [Propionibacteriaceae bacterium]|nr:penicillin-binding protein 2 [Propionibacteriaceae bacterium]